MTKRGLLSVAIRVVGLVLLLRMLDALGTAISILISYRSYARTDESYASSLVFGVFVAAVVWGALALVVLSCAEGIARLLVREDGEAAIPQAPDEGGAWFSVAARVVGLVAILMGLSAIVGNTARVLSLFASESAYASLPDKIVIFFQTLKAAHLESSAYTGVAQVVFGGYLLLGAAQLTRLVYRERRRRAEPGPE